jgi:hypothetical protein
VSNSRSMSRGHLPRTPAAPSTVSPQMAPRPFEADDLTPTTIGEAPGLHNFSNVAVTAPVQAKLTVGQRGDPYEQEADRVADQVMAMPDPGQAQVQRMEMPEEEELQMKPLGDSIQRMQVPEEEEELQMKPLGDSIQRMQVPEEEEELQMKAADAPAHEASPSLEMSLNQSKGGGAALDDATRSFVEPRMGFDFSRVRIHNDNQAVQMNQRLGARAFTHGSDIYFGAGQYNPGSDDGKRLLTHELTHVVQQGNSTNDAKQAIEPKFSIQGSTNALQCDDFFDFSDEPEVIESAVERIAGRGSGAGEREVEAEIAKLRGWVDLYLSAYRDGLNSFETTMNFSSDEEARPRYFDVALKEVGKVLLDELIDYATSGMPIIGPVVKGSKSVLTSLYDEAQRSQAAQGEARIREYIVSTRNDISDEGGIHRQLLQVMDDARPILLDRYQDAVASSAEGAPDDSSRQEMIDTHGNLGNVVGEAAAFIRDLKMQVTQFRQHIPTAAKFQRQFTEQFADTPGRTAPVSQGGRESGSLHLNMRIYRERHGAGDAAYWSYRVDDTDSSWELATTAPQSSRLAQSLMDTIGGSVANTSLPKYLYVRVETEKWGLNSYDRAIIYFRDPANPDFRGWDTRLSQWVWSLPNIKQTALTVTRITGD